jgi:predicted PhzF superfamily epimerase YddE/YHI9
MVLVQNGIDEGAWSSRIGSGDEGIPKADKSRLLSGKSRIIEANDDSVSRRTTDMRLFHVDAFTDELYKGNPAGVVLLHDTELSDETMKSIAKELKHSETAFVSFGKEEIGLRWFTPKREVDLCGHATLASAYVLFETGLFKRTAEIRFSTKSGILTARRSETGIEMDFP